MSAKSSNDENDVDDDDGAFDAGGRELTQWNDMTGSVPLKLTDDCVSFTTNLSARYHPHVSPSLAVSQPRITRVCLLH